MSDKKISRELVDWFLSRPKEIQDLMRQFPPACFVKTVPGVSLLVPAPGVEGRVQSYFENGDIGVVAEQQCDIFSVPLNKVVPKGTLLKGAVPAKNLEFVRAGGITREMVAAILDGNWENAV